MAMVAVENCANFGELTAFGAAAGLAACSACAGDYEDPEVTAGPNDMPTDSFEADDAEGQDLQWTREQGTEQATEEDSACEQSDEAE